MRGWFQLFSSQYVSAKGNPPNWFLRVIRNIILLAKLLIIIVFTVKKKIQNVYVAILLPLANSLKPVLGRNIIMNGRNVLVQCCQGSIFFMTFCYIIYRFAQDLMFYANQIPTVSTQLSIIANVHQGSTGDGDVSYFCLKFFSKIDDFIWNVTCLFIPPPHEVARYFMLRKVMCPSPDGFQMIKKKNFAQMSSTLKYRLSSIFSKIHNVIYKLGHFEHFAIPLFFSILCQGII